MACPVFRRNEKSLSEFPYRPRKLILTLNQKFQGELHISNYQMKYITAVQLLRENHEKLFSYKINLESFNLKARRTEHLYQLMQEIRAIAGYFSDKFYFLLCNVLFE